MKLLFFAFLLLIPFCSYAQNVGIGTATPDHKLVVEGDRIKLQNKEATKFFFLRTDGDEIDITTIGGQFWITAEEDKHIILNPSKSSSGFVGIGTYNPTEKLHVEGGARIESLSGESNRFIYASPTGVLYTSSIDIFKLEQSVLQLQEKIAQQELLIQELLQKLEEKD